MMGPRGIVPKHVFLELLSFTLDNVMPGAS
jgi:hypothetical protein